MGCAPEHPDIHRYRQALDAERAQWQAEIANLRLLTIGLRDDDMVSVGAIREALRGGPQPAPGNIPPGFLSGVEPAPEVLYEYVACSVLDYANANGLDGTERSVIDVAYEYGRKTR